MHLYLHIMCSVDAPAHIVPPLSVGSIHGVRPAVQAVGHLEGPNELSCSNTTGALHHDAGKAHLS